MLEIINDFILIGKGVTLTLELLLCGIIMGLTLGTLIAICRYKNYGRWILPRIVSIIRGTPLILQMAFVYFVVPGYLNIKLSVLSAGIITLGLNSAAYISEIIRSGITSIPKGQFEAANTLNIPQYHTWKDIILPQVIKNVLPAIINEVISLSKETSIIATIGGVDLMRSAQIVAAEQFTYFMPLCIAGVYYYILVMIFEYIGKKITNKSIAC
jgi:polar amino acid transport system permease protein